MTSPQQKKNSSGTNLKIKKIRMVESKIDDPAHSEKYKGSSRPVNRSKSRFLPPDTRNAKRRQRATLYREEKRS